MKCFGGLTGDYCAYERSDIVVLPVPFDLTCTWGKGAAAGPDAILEASANMELYDIETESEIFQRGIHTAEPVKASSCEEMVSSVYGKVRSFLSDGKYPVVLGGEHSVSVGAIKAQSGFFSDLSVLHLDAHSDRRPEYEGNPLSHACAMARARDYVDNIVSVGIRSMDSSELEYVDEDHMFYAHDIVGEVDWVSEAVGLLSDSVYVTIDLDVFDPSLMPSTGTPEPGGLDWYAVTDFLAYLCAERKVVGFDVVELSPMKGNRAPDFLAAKLVYRFLSEIFYKE